MLRAMPEVRDRICNVRLLVVGDFAGDRQAYVDMINEEKIEKEVAIYDGYIPDREVEKFFSACDVVVLPYESATQSGIVQIAYGFDKPVIATDVGGLSDVVIQGKTGHLVPPGDVDALSAAIIGFFEDGEAEQFATVSVIAKLAGL